MSRDILLHNSHSRTDKLVRNSRAMLGPDDLLLRIIFEGVKDLSAAIIALASEKAPLFVIKKRLEIIDSWLDDYYMLQEPSAYLSEIASSLCVYKLIILCERYKYTRNEETRADATKLLNNRTVYAKLSEVYRLDSSYLVDSENYIRMHEVGTTSFIVHLQRKDLALKLIFPRYFDNAQITLSTQHYRNDYGSISTTMDGDHIAPEIILSSERYIIMQFVQGETLEDFIRRQSESNSTHILSRPNAELIRDILLRLCDKLSHLESCGIQHYDLSPSNIILDYRPYSNTYNPILIDFGYNYVLTERIGSIPLESKEHVYIAPELASDPNRQDSHLPDLYSLGMIMLEMTTPSDLSPTNVSRSLEQLWNISPEIAQLVELFISHNPKVRAFCCDNERSVFIGAGKVINNHINMHIRFNNNNWRTLWQLTIDALFEIHRMISPEMNLNAFKYTRIGMPHYGKQWVFSLVSAFSMLYIIILYIMLFSLDTGIDFPLLTNIAHLIGLARVPSGNWIEYQPARLVGLSFGIVATAYYINIFAYITLLPDRKYFNAILRAQSFIYIVPITIGMLYPSLWALCSGIGVIIVGINNYAMLCFARSAWENVKKNGSEITYYAVSSTELENFQGTFSEWPRLMFVYGVALMSLHYALETGIARDEWIYAIIVAGVINIAKLLRENCVHFRDFVRSSIERLYFLDCAISEYIPEHDRTC